MEIQKNMAAILYALKEISGKSMTEFSEELEISRSALQEYLSGNGNPNMTTLDHMAKKLNVDPAVLVSDLFTDGQLQIVLKLLESLQILSTLSRADRLRFAQLFVEMMSLWNEDKCLE